MFDSEPPLALGHTNRCPVVSIDHLLHVTSMNVGYKPFVGPDGVLRVRCENIHVGFPRDDGSSCLT